MKTRIVPFIVVVVLLGFSRMFFAEDVSPTPPATSPPLAKTGRETSARLREPVSIRLAKGATLDDLRRILKDEHGVQSVLNTKEIIECGCNGRSILVDRDVAMDGFSLEEFLHVVLERYALDCLIDEEGFLLITSREKTASRLTTKAYGVADLVRPEKPVHDPESMINESYARMAALIDVIEQTIDPDSWYSDEEVIIEASSTVFVVRHHDRVHREIERFLDQMRAELKKQEK